MQHGFSANTPRHIVLGGGALYANFVSPESKGTKIGATRGGNKFDYTPEVNNIGFDGSPGKVKEMDWLVSATVTLEVNLIELTPAILKMAAPGLVSEDYPASPAAKTYDKITGSFTIAATEYQNIALVADVKDKTDPLIVVVKNALSNSPLSLNFQDKESLVQTITFEGRFDGTDLETPPFEIYNPVDNT